MARPSSPPSLASSPIIPAAATTRSGSHCRRRSSAPPTDQAPGGAAVVGTQRPVPDRHEADGGGDFMAGAASWKPVTSSSANIARRARARL
ncbi:MAG TPA: hypothetical protein VGJ44_26300, partial [Kribbellaceae bacterium]